MKRFLLDVRDAGFSGVQNFPTVGLFDGTFRVNLEETGMGYGKEVEMIALASEMGLLTCPYVFTVEEARQMAAAGADVLIPHMGLTTKGSIGARTAMTLADAAKRVQELADAAKQVKPDILVLCHGGPISEPEDVRFILSKTKGIAGFFGASSIERLPTEVAITGCVKEFKTLQVK
jgi:predicted TIM-barrel enzyme